VVFGVVVDYYFGFDVYGMEVVVVVGYVGVVYDDVLVDLVVFRVFFV